MLSLEAMLRHLYLILPLSAAVIFAQTPPAAAQRPAMAETPNTDIHYALAPDALVQDGVPKGEIRGPFTLPSEAYPGTQHTYWIYVPAQYDPATPARLMIYNDGQAFMAPEGDVRAQVVMDNLIYRREIPVMIGVFINPGRRPDQPEPNGSNWGDRDTNRPTEYNTSTRASSWMNCCRCFTRTTTFRRTPNGMVSADRVQAPLQHSLLRGSARINSTKC